ncbi:uncharacterized protein LOC5519417 [Nematostella vectensis]|uniref:uncharacterized protein LOC5519417 n=1 Tax=Nematostella vectensis TaxID=45351 RepID=UPI0020777642|nr:uncharacterized protein LOC5519417 [Nematostella vectensis]
MSHSKREEKSRSYKQWKVWLTSNYTQQKGKHVPIADILEHADMVKDRFILPLDRRTLGSLVKELYNDVTISRRQLEEKKYRVYVNLEKSKSLCKGGEDNMLAEATKFATSHGWHVLTESDRRLSLIKIRALEFNGMRVTTEICVEEGIEKGPLRLALKSMGRLVDPENILQVDLSIGEKLLSLMALMEKSKLCEGIDDDESFFISGSWLRGTLKDTSITGPNSCKNKIFSNDCVILAKSYKSRSCSKCDALKNNIQQNKRRKVDGEPSPYCNYRWLDKHHLEQKLKDKTRKMRNAKQKDKNLKEV